jgi:hypothetical protein
MCTTLQRFLPLSTMLRPLMWLKHIPYLWVHEVKMGNYLLWYPWRFRIKHRSQDSLSIYYTYPLWLQKKARCRHLKMWYPDMGSVHLLQLPIMSSTILTTSNYRIMSLFHNHLCTDHINSYAHSPVTSHLAFSVPSPHIHILKLGFSPVLCKSCFTSALGVLPDFL